MSAPITATVRQVETRDLDAIFVLLQAFAISFVPDRGVFETSARNLL